MKCFFSCLYFSNVFFHREYFWEQTNDIKPDIIFFILCDFVSVVVGVVFYFASAFNSDISEWDVASVTNMVGST